METRQSKDEKTVAIFGALLVVVMICAATTGALALADRWVGVSDGIRATVFTGALLLGLVLAIARLVRRRSQLARSAEDGVGRR